MVSLGCYLKRAIMRGSSDACVEMLEGGFELVGVDSA